MACCRALLTAHIVPVVLQLCMLEEGGLLGCSLVAVASPIVNHSL
jgi:hypothetical protein